MQKTILVVEDDPDMRAWISLHLSKAGYKVKDVANGLQAAAACLAAKPDLVISDLHMPGMGGFDMLKILNTERGLKDIPVIFLTADEAKRREQRETRVSLHRVPYSNSLRGDAESDL